MISNEADRIKKVEKEFNTYLKKISNKDLVRGHQGQWTYDEFFSNRLMVVVAIREGVTNSLFMSIKDSTPFSDADWSSFLDISEKSLQRYKKDKDHVFRSIHSEKIFELAEVTDLGREVFDTTDQFYLWLNTPSFALGKMKPVELLKDSYGKEMVMNELNRIDHGVFA